MRTASVATGLITDGPAIAQRAKIEALGLQGLIDVMILTDELCPPRPKPSREAYRQLETRVRGGEAMVYVGDNPLKILRRRTRWDGPQFESGAITHFISNCRHLDTSMQK